MTFDEVETPMAASPAAALVTGAASARGAAIGSAPRSARRARHRRSMSMARASNARSPRSAQAGGSADAIVVDLSDPTRRSPNSSRQGTTTGSTRSRSAPASTRRPALDGFDVST